MKVHFNVTWGKTALYNSGQRDFMLDWKQMGGIPRRGDAIDIPKFMEKDYTSDEVFMHKDSEVNVFDWIENTTGWEVAMLKWDYKDGSILLHILVTDKG